jgi:HTH-type transcriptional regulator / antitoxin HipB
MPKRKTLKTLDEFKDQEYGKKGDVKREKLEEDYVEFKLGALIKEARLKKGMTQQQLADKCGANKAYISKIENDIKEVRISTLKNIVEKGLNGQLKLSIALR